MKRHPKPNAKLERALEQAEWELLAASVPDQPKPQPVKPCRTSATQPHDVTCDCRKEGS